MLTTPIFLFLEKKIIATLELELTWKGLTKMGNGSS